MRSKGYRIVVSVIKWEKAWIHSCPYLVPAIKVPFDIRRRFQYFLAQLAFFMEPVGGVDCKAREWCWVLLRIAWTAGDRIVGHWNAFRSAQSVEEAVTQVGVLCTTCAADRSLVSFLLHVDWCSSSFRNPWGRLIFRLSGPNSKSNGGHSDEFTGWFGKAFAHWRWQN